MDACDSAASECGPAPGVSEGGPPPGVSLLGPTARGLLLGPTARGLLLRAGSRGLCWPRPDVVVCEVCAPNARPCAAPWFAFADVRRARERPASPSP
jgi:hypothetical protein